VLSGTGERADDGAGSEREPAEHGRGHDATDVTAYLGSGVVGLPVDGR
jgi:hypothetical protein